MTRDNLSDRLRFITDRHECPGERDCSYCEVLREAADRLDVYRDTLQTIASDTGHPPTRKRAEEALRDAGGGD